MKLILLLVIGLTCVHSVTSRQPSWKDCKKRKVHVRKYDRIDAIDCSYKEFKTVPRDAMEFQGATFIKLGKNPYVCDCKMEWFRKFISSSNSDVVKILDDENIKCAEPADLKGTRVRDIWKPLCKATSWKDCKQQKWFNLLDCTELDMESVPLDLFSTPWKSIMLSDNPYNCDCSMKWFIRKRRLKDFSQQIDDDLLMECAKPANFAGKKISSLKEEDVCPTSKDIDECKKNIHDCHEDAVCEDKKEGFTCSCKSGYTGDGKTCTDINECVDVKCPTNSSCVNIAGSYECECNRGFSKSGQQCSDIDECADKITECSEDATCLNTVGSYQCICKPGYISHNDGKVCKKQERKSCTSKPSPCADANEVCIDNEDGTFKCSCRPGFVRGLSHKKCQDVNECLLKTPCPVNGVCKNTYGSYKCSCKKGFIHHGKHCVDIDECGTGKHDCHRDAVCVNHDGGYNCRCKPGYEQVNHGKSCVKKGKPFSSIINLDHIKVASLALFLVLMALVIFLVIRKKKRRKLEKASDGKPAQQKKKQQQTFFFDADPVDVMMMNIPPGESNISQWSEDEDSDEFGSDNNE